MTNESLNIINHSPNQHNQLINLHLYIGRAMKKQIIITVILLAATAIVTVLYFKNLNPPGTRNSLVMEAIPGNASIIFEFNNDKSFYEIFNGNQLFPAVVGKQKLDELDTLQQKLLLNPVLEKYFTGQNIYISFHPSNKNDVDLLLSISSSTGYDLSLPNQLTKQLNSDLTVTPLYNSGKQIYNIYIKQLKKSFYIFINEDNILQGSFSKQLIDQCTNYKIQKDKQSFVLLSEQQNTNSLANLYVNYQQLSILFNQLFKNKNTDIFRSFRLMPGLASLTLNYRTDALMFNGSTTIDHHKPPGYFNLFCYQEPVSNHLKDILPSTTAYCTSFSISDPIKFESNLAQSQTVSGLKKERETLFNQIKTETGINLQPAFRQLLGNEFAVVTTKYIEKFAIISVIDGSKLSLLLSGISKATSGNAGIFNYDQLPLFLLGDAFSNFKRPYFLIVDNYLVLANSPGELASYYDIYINRKFLTKNDNYNEFDNLLTEQSNVSFVFNFKNSMPILKRDMYPDIYDNIQKNEPGWKNFYALSCQLTAADKNFYTNLCIQLNSDSTLNKK